MTRLALFATLLITLLVSSSSYSYTPTNALNNAQLQGMATITYPGGVCRDTYGNGNGATTLCFQPSNAACSLNSGNGDGGSQVKSSDGKCWVSNTTDPLQFGASPGTYNFPGSVTTTAGSGSVTISGGLFTPFTAANIGNWITILGAGPNEQHYIGQITGVTSGTQITVSPNPTLSMSAFSTIVYYGPPNAVPINAAIAAGNRLFSPVVMPAGIYMVEAPIQCTMVNYNNANLAPPVCVGVNGAGAVLMAVNGMAASSPVANTVFTIGGYANGSDFTQFIRNGQFNGNGLTIDCNMIAGYGFGMPFFQDAARVGGYNVKNCLTANFHFGSTGSPITSAGINLTNNSVQRDIYLVPVTSISCSGGQATLTTSIDHGIATGRVVAGININSLPGSTTGTGPIVLLWQSTGARTGIIHGVNCTGWAAYTGGGSIAMGMASASVIHTVTGMTSASPTQITISPGDINLANGQTWCLYGIGSTTASFILQQSVPDGCYTVSSVGGAGADGPTQFTVPVNAAASTFSSGGIAFQQQPMGSVGVYEDNVSDFNMQENIITGVTYGVDINPASAGYQGKYVANHFYNLAQHGWMMAAHRLGGRNTLVGEQCDTPVVFCGQFESFGNNSAGTGLNAAGFNWILDNASWLWRLDPCSGPGCLYGTSDMSSTGDKLTGQSASLRPNELSNHLTAGNASWGSSVPNYKSAGNSCAGSFTLYCLPDTAVGTQKFVGTPANPTGTASASVVAMGLGTTCAITPLYKTSVYFSIYGSIASTVVSSGAFGSIFVGTGAAPANGGSLGGATQIGNQSGLLAEPLASAYLPFAWQGTLSNLTPLTTYWFDAGLRAVTSGTASLAGVTCTAMEQ